MHTLAQLRSGALAGVRRLDLSCGLTAFPSEIYGLADTLEVLNLSGNALDALPQDLGRLRRLRVVFCSDNRFVRLPEALGDCPGLEMVGFKANRIAEVPAAALPPRLRWLILTDNAVEALPPALGERPRLQKLMLAGNRLRALPDGLAGAERLELLRISANDFHVLPPWLADLPRLAWLACAGNPALAAVESPANSADGDGAVPEVPWARLALGALLGQGASGEIHRATLAAAPGDPDGAGGRDVAVKLFRAAVTSDGWPAREMAACVAAGAHPHLVGAQGRIAGHPAGRQGLVMPLVDPAFGALAGPPSLESCTRDVYPPGLRLAPGAARRIATGVAAAAAHLHARGIVHGDLYAHNVLVRADGAALLGDFGGAWRVPAAFGTAAGTVPAARWQALDVRALGCLLEELAAHADPADAQDAQALRALAERCLQRDPARRPRAAEAHAALAAQGAASGA
ncbi:MAG: leucine-rich repeat-containing protein kinase family protein [Xylophilus ampelinus]